MNKEEKNDIVINKTTEISTIQEPINLSVNFTGQAMKAMQDQRFQLKEFISNQLREGINNDFAKIPGTPKKSLLKPGAEKLANLFQLGSRIISREKEISFENNYAMFQYTVEVFHLPTGKVLAQCEAMANSQETKYMEKTIWEDKIKKKVPQRIADVMNTLSKMAQKRAYVGAIIIAVGASDFFTQDIEETSDLRVDGKEKAQTIQADVENREPGDETIMCSYCNIPLARTKANTAWYCPNFKVTPKNGEQHSYIKD